MSGGSGGGATDLNIRTKQLDRQKPAELTSGTGNAADDGYTVTARRPRGATPGDIESVEDAAQTEKMNAMWGGSMSPYGGGFDDY